MDAHTHKQKQRCARCGSCTVVCPVYRASGGKECYSGRGKKYLLEVYRQKPPSAVFEDIFSKCLLCGACESVCPRGVEITREVREAREEFSLFYGEYGYRKFLARKVLERPELLGVVRSFGRSFSSLLAKRLASDSGLRLQLALFDTPTLHQEHPGIAPPVVGVSENESVFYFPGCSSSYLFPEISRATIALLSSLGFAPEVPAGLRCCGVAMDAAGDGKTAVDLARKNLDLFDSSDAPVVVSCGSCYAHLIHYPSLFADGTEYHEKALRLRSRLVELMQLVDKRWAERDQLAERVDHGREIRVFYHDPCHLRHSVDITAEPRRILRRLKSVKLLELEDGPQCCGQGGLFHLGAPELAATIRDDLAAQVLEMNPDIITSTCSGCLMQWRTALAAQNSHIPVLHLAQFLCSHG